MIYACCDRQRREAVRSSPDLNGIDYLEVVEQQRVLLVWCLKPVPPLAPENVRITGGVREPGIEVEWVDIDPNFPNVVTIGTGSTGDFSRYTLRLVISATSDDSPDTFDPLLSAVEFSFKVECQSDFDCRELRRCPPAVRPHPDIDYLARDYGTFRRLLLDRIAQLVPGWRERSAADVGVVLAELLAYVGDQLSYGQDAVATEAYIGTARQRISLRRHARLVDYHMHDGCNARAWVCVEVDSRMTLLRTGTQFLTRIAGAPVRILPSLRNSPDIIAANPLVFEPLEDVELFPEHNRLRFYSWSYTEPISGERWSDGRCCLPQGATRALLSGVVPNLGPGTVLIFEEAKGPNTGDESDRNPERRHAVRLTDVRPFADLLTGDLATEIQWHDRDALPWPLCVSWTIGEGPGAWLVEDVSIARGNVVLVDHGGRVDNESLGEVPARTVVYAPSPGSDPCHRETRSGPARFWPSLSQRPLTRQLHVDRENDLGGGRSEIVKVPFDNRGPAGGAILGDPARAIPCVLLESELDGRRQRWTPEADLLDSEPADNHFVVETEHDGTARLRFGDDRHGSRPDARTRFTAHYRVGNGLVGNVGPEAIAHVVTDQAGVTLVRNPMAAQGGLEPETTEEVRRRAPQAFRIQERAVTTRDYAEKTELLTEEVQRAAAVLRWTGSWNTVFVAVDPRAERTIEPQRVVRHLERYRMAGQDLDVLRTRYVPLELEMLVCVKPDYLRTEVRTALIEELSNRNLPDGRRGVFHPDNLTFGQPVYLSPIYRAVRMVDGVASVEIRKFQRLGVSETKYLAEGKLQVGRLEIPRLDNDPSFPDNGRLTLDLRGGR